MADMGMYLGGGAGLERTTYHAFRQQSPDLAWVDHSGQSHYQGRPENKEKLTGEAREFQSIMKSYLRSEKGQDFIQYANQRLSAPVNVVGYGATDNLDDKVIAALMHTRDKVGVIIGNYTGGSFDEKVSRFADSYKGEVSRDEMREFVLLHELSHQAAANEGGKVEYRANDYVDKYCAHKINEAKAKGDTATVARYQRIAKVAKNMKQRAKKEGK
ncbi:MAG: hypothetical protein ABIH82_05210 [Candidatus Woesearchaeota archaeon]